MLECLKVMLEEEESSPQGIRADFEVWQLLRSVMQEMGIPCPKSLSLPSLALAVHSSRTRQTITLST